MSVDCGAVYFMDGGTIKSSTITDSTIQGSVINGSVVEASKLTNTTAVDSNTAQVIADAIAKLDTENLRALGKAIAEAMPAPKPTAGPETTTDTYLPTEMIGSRRYVMGAPAGWIEWRGVIIPAYKAGE